MLVRTVDNSFLHFNQYLGASEIEGAWLKTLNYRCRTSKISRICRIQVKEMVNYSGPFVRTGKERNRVSFKLQREFVRDGEGGGASTD